MATFFDSTKVTVFPCSYRGTDSNGNVYNPESRMMNEYNFINSSGLGDENNTYIISYTVNSTTTATVKCVVAGYYFELTGIAIADIKGKLLYVKIIDPTGTSTIKTKVLGSQRDNSDLYLDYGEKFYGLGAYDSEQSGLSGGLQILDASGLNKKAFLSSKDLSGNFKQTAEGTISAGEFSAVFGKGNTVGATAAFATGENTKAIGEASFAAGIGDTATTYKGASGKAAFAEGNATTASGNYSHAQGNATKAEGESSFAGGYNTTASETASTALGISVNATQAGQTVVGQYSANSTKADSLFIVGNGKTTTKNKKTNTTTSNALEITKDAAYIDVPTNISKAVNIGTSSATADTTIYGDTKITGATAITGNTTITGTAEITEKTTMKANADIEGNATITGTLEVTKAITGSNTLSATEITGTKLTIKDDTKKQIELIPTNSEFDITGDAQIVVKASSATTADSLTIKSTEIDVAKKLAVDANTIIENSKITLNGTEIDNTTAKNLIIKQPTIESYYVCKTTGTKEKPSATATNWVSIGTSINEYDSETTYAIYDLVLSSGTYYTSKENNNEETPSGNAKKWKVVGSTISEYDSTKTYSEFDCVKVTPGKKIDKIELNATDINLNGNTAIDGTTTISGDTTVKANITITGSATISGDYNCQGDIKVATDHRITAPTAELDELSVGIKDEKTENIFNIIYPVGSIYISMVNSSPETLFGRAFAGEWIRLKDGTLWAVDKDATSYTDPKTTDGILPVIKGEIQILETTDDDTLMYGTGPFFSGERSEIRTKNTQHKIELTTSQKNQPRILSFDSSQDYDYYTPEGEERRNTFHEIYSGDSKTVRPTAYHVYMWVRKS